MFCSLHERVTCVVFDVHAACVIFELVDITANAYSVNFRYTIRFIF